MYGGKGQGVSNKAASTVDLVPGAINNALSSTPRTCTVFGTSHGITADQSLDLPLAGRSCRLTSPPFQGANPVQAYGPGRSTSRPRRRQSMSTPIPSLISAACLLGSAAYAWLRSTKSNQCRPPPGLREVKPTTSSTSAIGPPKDPAIYDGVGCRALLRGQNPDARSHRPQLLHAGRARAAAIYGRSTIRRTRPCARSPCPPRIVGLSAKGTIPCRHDQRHPSATPQAWWTSTNTAPVDTEIVVNGEVRQAPGHCGSASRTNRPHSDTPLAHHSGGATLIWH